MRRRRAERCRIRAEEALAAGFVDEAREALEESRRLSPSETPTLGELVQLIDERLAPPVTVPDRSLDRRYAAATTATILLGVLAYVATGSDPGPSQQASALVPSQVQTATQNPAPAAAPDRRVLIERDTVAAELLRRTTDPAATPATQQAVVPASLDPRPEPAPVATSGGEPLPAVVDAVPPPVTPAPPSPTTLTSIPGPSPATALSPIALPPAAAPAAERSTEAPPASEPPEPRIRSVLASYASAFGRLDAAAVSGVWPGVDARALARAFDGLSSQSVSLGTCAIAVDGDAATARCSGSTTWAPKVGGGARTEPRQWDFVLQHTRDTWHIVRVNVR